MDPTFHTGEYLIVDQLTYKTFDDPKRGSVVIFRYPEDPSKFFIKRIIGLPNETVEISGSEVRVFNNENPDGFVLNEDYVVHKKNDYMKKDLESDEYFVMGDNRPQSSDSRIWGPVKKDLIAGRPLVRLFPINKLDVLPGDESYSH